MANTNFSKWQATRRSSISGISYENNDAKSVSPASGYPTQFNDMAPKTGKWYIEFYNHVQNGYNVLGIVQQESVRSDDYGNWLPDGSSAADYQKQYLYYSHNGKKSTRDSGGSGSTTNYGNSWNSAGTIMACALDMDNGKVWWAKNGTWQNSGDPAAGSNAAFDDLDTSDGYYMAWSDYYSGQGGTMGINAGQDSTFGGATSAGTGVDDNGFGNFKYSPPTGFLALCTANLELSADIDPAQTDDNYPGKLFNTVAYTGTGSARSVTGFNFQPDMVWIKNYASPGNQANRIVDSNRGVSKAMIPEDTQQENTETTAIQSFDTDGFTLGSVTGGYNTSSGSYVAWGWKANGGTTVSNSQGSITATVQANQAAGFSIVTYTGNDGSWGSGNRDTFGHGLSAAPEFMIFKERNNTDAWTVFHHSVGDGGGSSAAHNNLRLDTNDTLYTNQSYKSFGGTMPTSTLVTVEGNTTNSSSSNHIAYIWHGVEGYSKFGRFTANGNVNGPFIYTGFRPRLLVIKGIDATNNWFVFDTARTTHNPVNKNLHWDTSDAEETSTEKEIDILSTGFKLRSENGGLNHPAGDVYVYMAWGDVPFKYANAF